MAYPLKRHKEILCELITTGTADDGCLSMEDTFKKIKKLRRLLSQASPALSNHIKNQYGNNRHLWEGVNEVDELKTEWRALKESCAKENMDGSAAFFYCRYTIDLEERLPPIMTAGAWYGLKTYQLTTTVDTILDLLKTLDEGEYLPITVVKDQLPMMDELGQENVALIGYLDAACACISGQDLVGLMEQPLARVSLLVKHAFNRNVPLPHQVLDIPLTNYVIMTGGDVHLVQRLEAAGYPLQLPLPVQELPHHIWKQVWSKCLKPEVIRWILESHPGINPLDLTPTELYNDYGFGDYDSNLEVLYVLVVIGGFELSDEAFSWLLWGFGLDVNHEVVEMGEYHRLFLAKAKGALESGGQQFLSNGCSTMPHIPLPQVVEILLDYVDTPAAVEIMHAVIENDNNGESEDLGVIAPHLLDFKRRGLLDHLSDDCRDFVQKYSDRRLVEYLYPKTSSYVVTMPKDPSSFLFEPPDCLVSFTKDLQVPVHLQAVVDQSKFLKAMTEDRGFKRVMVTDEGSGRKHLHLEGGVPEQIQDPRAAVHDWLTFCYCGVAPQGMSVDRMVDLQALADYLQDKECVAYAAKLLEREWLEDFRVHREQKQHRRAMDTTDCPVCTHWWNSYSVEG